MHNQLYRRTLPEFRGAPQSKAAGDEYASRAAYFLETTAALRDQIESQHRLSPDQEAALNGLAERLGIESPVDANYRIFRELWAAENNEQVYLTTVDALPPHLAKEQCCFIEPAVWRQPDAQHTGTSSPRFSAPFPLKKCASYRIGSLKPRHRALDGTREMATGKLYITELKLFFDSETLSTSTTFNGIVNVECYSNGIEVGKTNGRSDFFQMASLASEYAYMIIHELNRLR
jgi:hypothetical protein